MIKNKDGANDRINTTNIDVFLYKVIIEVTRV